MIHAPTSPILNLQSNVGMIVLYDPTLLRERVKAPSTWWSEDPLAADERQDGRMVVFPIGSGKRAGRGHRVRLGEELAESERPYVSGSVGPCPLRVQGEELFLGPVERLPGDGSGDRLPTLPDQGGLIACAPGRYHVTAHVLDWQADDRFFNEDNEPTPDAPPDFVLCAVPQEGALCAPPADPTPLLELIKRKAAIASKKVTHATRPRSPETPPEPERRPRRRSEEGGARAASKPPLKVVELRPGEMGVGARVRHPAFGVGTVLFVREGFPKARVSFQGHEHKVDRDELTVI